MLAIVRVDGDDVEDPYYIRRPFAQEPDRAVTCIHLDRDRLHAVAEARL